MGGPEFTQTRATLRLYRHLLREATYLPPVVRPFFWDRLTTRFHLHQRDSAPEARIRRAHQDLRYLQSANAGHSHRMRRVLMLGFGRIGRRRRELISDLVRKNGRCDTGSSTTEEPRRLVHDDDFIWDDWLAGWDRVKVRALAKSQTDADLPETPLPTGKSLTPEDLIPTKNIWGTPLAKKLARSKLRKEYKVIIKRLLPPVEASEWQLLRSLAAGDAGREYDVPTRRTKAIIPEPGRPRWQWKDYLLKPVRAVDANKSRKLRSLTGEVDDTSPFPRSALGVHRVTGRTWRRLYADVWRMTPTMTKQEHKNKWATKWGKLEAKKAEASTCLAEFFDGVSNSGRSEPTSG